MIGLWGLYFLELCWHWSLLWFFTGGRHQQFLVIPPLIFPCSKTQLCWLRKLHASLLPPSQRPPAPVLLSPLFFFLLPLLYLHQLFKAFGCCWVYNKPILQGKTETLSSQNIVESIKRCGKNLKRHD